MEKLELYKNNKHGMHQFSFILSVLCAIHCLTLPIIISVLPTVSQFLHLNLWLEVLMLVVIFLTGFLVFFKDLKIHKHYLPMVIFIIGLIVVILNHLYVSNYTTLISIIGGILLISSHIINWRLHKLSCKHS